MNADMTGNASAGESGIPGMPHIPSVGDNPSGFGASGLPEAPGLMPTDQPVPGVCSHGLIAIEELRNPATTVVRLGQIRATLACPGCIQAFNTELKFRTTLTAAAWETPPPELSTRISAAMESMDLSSLDISDFEF